MTLEIKGSLDFDLAGKRTREGAVRGLQMATEHVLQVSNTKVPNEEGTLERSGRATIDERELTGAVSYDTPYAPRQHEDLDYRHSGGRQAKFLESSMTEETAVVRELVATQIRRALR